LEGKQQEEASDNLQEKAASAGVVTMKLSSDGFEPEDYHDRLNGEKFVAWLTNRLLTAFEKKYGRRARMVLILDNAKYHHARGEDWINVREWNALQLGNYLRTAKVKEITVERKKKENGVTSMVKLIIPASKFTADKKDGGPTKAELLTVVLDYVKSHPIINSTLVEQALENRNRGHQLLYTPPYESWLQPIELVWARVKHQVATQAYTGRTWQQTAAQTKAALRNITPELCQRLIQHTHNLMDTWIQGEKSGSLRQFGSLDQLSRATPQQLSRVTDLELADSLIVGDAITDRENVNPMQE